MKVVNRMKLLGFVGLVAFALSPAVSWADAPAGSGIKDTDHDFTQLGVGFDQGTLATAVGSCTFCHTPHKALSTLLLWNHTLSTQTFTWDVPKTTAGTDFPSIVGNTYKGSTAKCLSCHDGSVAIGDVNWFMEQAWPSPTSLNEWKMSADPSHQIGGGGNMAGNHPVAMPYPYNQAANTYNGKTTGPAAVLTEWQTDPSLLTAAKIRLFNDDGSGNISAGPVAGKTGIECSSCHDPHNKAAIAEMFLRGNLVGNSQADGYLCLQCHIK